jgi:hypothetical protein
MPLDPNNDPYNYGQRAAPQTANAAGNYVQQNQQANSPVNSNGSINTNIGGQGYGSFGYRGGESESSFINRNAMADIKNPKTWTTGGFSLIPQALKGRRDYKRSRAMYERYQNLVASNQRNYDYENYNQQQDQQRLAEDEMRKKAIGALETSFASPQRAASREAMYAADLGSERENLNYGYKNSVRDSSLEALRRGRLGSSVDAEKQSALRNTLNSGLTEAENSANTRRAMSSELDDRQLQQLRRALLAGDPQSEQDYRAQAQQSQGELDRYLAGGQREQRDRERAAQDQYERNSVWGNLANAGASGIYGYYQNPQYRG